MPELPEVETVCRGLAPVMEGAKFFRVELNRNDLRFPFPENFAGRLEGRSIVSLKRRAKYILADLDDGMVLTAHLGMSGSFRIEVPYKSSTSTPGAFYQERSAARAHDHVVFQLQRPEGEARVIYNDPRRFGYMDLVSRNELASHRHFSGLGMEPLGNEFGSKMLSAVLSGKSAPIKAALLDQSLIAGLGNIYVCEALWMSGLSPLRPANSVAGNPAECRRLADSIRDVLQRAIDAGGSTLRDHRQTDGELGYFQHSFMVYGREGEHCLRPRCKGVVSRMVQSGRSTFYCPKCQNHEVNKRR